MDRRLRISLPQLPVFKADFQRNLEQHAEMVRRSAHVGADLVVFPELSLTGYELELLQSLAVSPSAEHFAELSNAAVEHNTVVIAGCPLVRDGESMPAIGAVICFPDTRVEFYCKQFLHEGEGNSCSAGSSDYFFELRGSRLALAICADFANPLHAQGVAEQGADLYLVSALISEAGYKKLDSEILSHLARRHQMPVILSNHISRTGGWDTFGHNAVWDAKGKRTLSTNSRDSCMLLCTFEGQDIQAEVYP